MDKNILIRPEIPADYFAAELMTKRAFWNLHVPGCNEHYMLHKMRTQPEYIPELSRVAELDGRILGGIYYSRARVVSGESEFSLLTFGPLCVDPDYQSMGIGGALLEQTLTLAREQGHSAVIIYGEPGYYPRHGFKTCDNFGITTPDGKNFDAFMGIELIPGALKAMCGGKFYEAPFFDDLPQAEVDAYDESFPYMPKLKLPGQWE